MPSRISPLSDIHPSAQIGDNVQIGPFCVIGPDVSLGDGCVLDSHVAVVGRTTIGQRNRFWPGSVIGGEPQDKSYVDGATGTVIGDDNQFREGVTVHRGAEKEDGITRIGDRNLLMSNAHVAHNCHVFNDTILVNGVLLGGHAFIHDRAIISGNSVVHHFTTVGACAIVGGGSRVTFDIPPYMMAFGSECASVRSVNLIGMQRAGISSLAIEQVKLAHRLHIRQFKSVAQMREAFNEKYGETLTPEVVSVFEFLERQRLGKSGRQREVFRNAPAPLKAAA